MGTVVDCPKCGQKICIPLHIFSVNPFHRPLKRLLGNLTSIQWHFPYFPQAIEASVLVFVVAITVVLYLTAGIASQIAGILQSLMLDARQEIKTRSLVEKSAYAVAAGVYLILWLPLWLVLLPFTVLGWTWRHLGNPGLILLVLAAGILAAIAFGPWNFTTRIRKLISEPSAVPYSEPVAQPPQG